MRYPTLALLTVLVTGGAHAAGTTAELLSSGVDEVASSKSAKTHTDTEHVTLDTRAEHSVPEQTDVVAPDLPAADTDRVDTVTSNSADAEVGRAGQTGVMTGGGVPADPAGRETAEGDSVEATRGESASSGGLSIASDANEAAAIPDETQPELKCTPPLSDDSAFGWTRDRLFGFVCYTGRWLDSGFGDRPYDTGSEKKIHGYLSYSMEQRQRNGFEGKPRFRVRLPFPNLKDRISLTVERDNEQLSTSGQTDDAARRLEGAVGSRNDSTTVAIGLEKRHKPDRAIDYKIGIRATQGKPNPYVRARYRREHGKTEQSVWRLSQSIFYRHVDGIGETSSVDYEHALSDVLAFRWANTATLTQKTAGITWESAGHLSGALAGGRTLRLTLSWRGEGQKEVDLQNYGYRVVYRQPLGRHWLIGELYAGHDFKREFRAEPRLSEVYGGARLEVHFGGQ